MKTDRWASSYDPKRRHDRGLPPRPSPLSWAEDRRMVTTFDMSYRYVDLRVADVYFTDFGNESAYRKFIRAFGKQHNINVVDSGFYERFPVLRVLLLTQTDEAKFRLLWAGWSDDGLIYGCKSRESGGRAGMMSFGRTHGPFFALADAKKYVLDNKALHLEVYGFHVGDGIE